MNTRTHQVQDLLAAQDAAGDLWEDAHTRGDLAGMDAAMDLIRDLTRQLLRMTDFSVKVHALRAELDRIDY
jgi:hypothetical protein